ncbi:transglycosylase SLT domain-containing protein [Chondromyces crocatus]|uniref:Exported transglycosylase n=1 Tax=Chondromyces crocatus TaxID=52 RepID=A0A0K1ECM6_CHOCO|nr:transglycosylase SLT domain-containing protein [Chondromyces crocatus]AKT38452.1 exported transglycosylase [Chondromyces crocatus]
MRTALTAALLGLLALGATASGCAEQRAAGPPPAQSTANVPMTAPSAGPQGTPPLLAAAVALTPPASRAPTPSWVDAMRLDRFAEAAEQLDTLPEADRARPEVRYARARVALALDDPELAVSLLHALEAELPLLAADIARHRAEAAFEAGPHAEAAAYFASSKSPRDLPRAAEAYARAGDIPQALAFANRAVAAAQRSKNKNDEAVARLARAHVFRLAAAPRPQKPRGTGPILTAPAAARVTRTVPRIEPLPSSPVGAMASAGAATSAEATSTSAGATAGSAPTAAPWAPWAPTAATPRPPRPHAATAKLPAPPAALADLRWIARSAPTTPSGQEARETLALLGTPLTPAERLDIADALLAGGRPAEAVVELTKLGPSATLTRPDLQHRRATALYRARDNAAAARAFLEAAASPTPRQPEQLYYAARSFLRQDQKNDAITRLREVVAKFPRTSWADDASYLLGQIYLQTGRYAEAAKQYTQFLGRAPRSNRRHDAEHDLALALISSGDPAGARTRLATLAKNARRVDDTARLKELEGLAALRAGDRAGAIQLWSDVMRSYPLSWGALTARARLVAAGAEPPPLLAPPTTTPPAPLAIQLPPTAALLTSVGLDADAERWVADNERTVSAPYGARSGEALCSLYGELTRAKRRYRVGVNAVAYDTLKRAPSDAERWAWECLYPQPYLPIVNTLEDEQGVPRALIYALMRQESAFDPVVVSPVSAVGLMQLMPTTAARAASEMELPFEPRSLERPEINLRLGTYYIAKLLRMFDGSLPLAAAAYNAGPQAVASWLADGVEQDTDLWVARIPFGETRHYVSRVLANLARYQWLAGGDAAVPLAPLTIPTGIRAPSDAY